MGRPFEHIPANGLAYGGWVVIDDSTSHWVVRCECGVERKVRRDFVIRGLSKRCMACAQRTHGMESSAIYTIWAGMKQRCQNPRYHGYANYGGRGIAVCERWQTFENFYADMGDKPPGKTLDRIDNDGPYSPDNCQWSTTRQQSNNRRKTIYVDLNGERVPLSIAAERAGINMNAVKARLRLGWTPEKAVTSPLRGT